MADSVPSNILRRKLAAARIPEADGGPGADRGWRLALARAARDTSGLALDVHALNMQRIGLAEMLEKVPERALIAVLQGPADSLGVIVLSAETMASVIEMLTMGRVNRGEPLARKPTRTDAAMCARLIDGALEALDVTLEDEADLSWAGGYRYASHLEDARPLGLILDDGEYRLLSAKVSLGLGQRIGQVLLALPADGRGAGATDGGEAEQAHHHAFASDLAERVGGASCALMATLDRVTLTLGEISGLDRGMILPLGAATIERVRLEGLDGRILGEGRLGQNRGMRAVRLTERPSVAVTRPAELEPLPLAEAEEEIEPEMAGDEIFRAVG